jgi:hypothetical protein
MKLLALDKNGVSFNEGGKYFDFVVRRRFYDWKMFIYAAVKVPGSQRWIRWWGGIQGKKGAKILWAGKRSC